MELQVVTKTGDRWGEGNIFAVGDCVHTAQWGGMSRGFSRNAMEIALEMVMKNGDFNIRKCDLMVISPLDTLISW